MGGKSSKISRQNYKLINTVPELCLPSAEGFSKQDLAVCIASISSMALTGVDSGLPRLGSTESYQLSSGEVSSSTSPTSVSTVDSIRAVKKKLRRRLRRHRSESVEDRSLAEHVAKHIELLDSLEKDDEDTSDDWASMRAWLLWCLHTKLGDTELNLNPDDPAIAEPCIHSGRLKRQSAFQEKSSKHLLVRQSQSIDSTDGVAQRLSSYSAQSSFESSGSAG
jgi:hypothetical protein